MKRTIAMLLVLMASLSVTIAQTRQVTGTVTDGAGVPIAGAIITADGKAVGVTTADGRFAVSLATSVKSVRISSVGFVDKDVTVAGSMLSVTLSASDATNLNEVVVTGYATYQRRQFTGAASTLNAPKIRDQPFGSFDQALQGASSGVTVISNSGQPGSNAVVRIRGNGSINGSNVPLYIVDGIEVTAADFASLNPADFEKFDVLKDGVATGIYGSRGANGVIVISTRRGRAGTLQLGYDTQVGFSDLPKDRLIVMNSSQKIDYELQRGNPYQWTVAEQDSLRRVNFSWKDALFQTGITHQHTVSVSGGSAASQLFASLSFMDQQGTLKTTGMQRWTANVRVDNTIKDWRFGVKVQAGYSKIVGTSEANTALASPLNGIRWSNPYERDINPNTGDFQETGPPGSLISGQPNVAMNLFLNYNWSLQTKALIGSYVEYHVPGIKGLYARTNWGLDYTNTESSAFTDPRVAGAQARNGALSRGTSRNARYTGTTSINYRTSFGDHTLDAGVYTEVVKNDARSFSFTGYGFTNGFNNEYGITAGSAASPQYIPAVSGSGSQNGLLSYFALVNYGYKKKYHLNLVGRRDGSSRFGANKRWANFGSVGAAWVVSDEDFLRSSKVISELRLRASFGTTGNQQGSPAGNYPIPTLARVSYGGIAGWTPGNPGNQDLTWESNQTINLGIDFALFSSRIFGAVELYERKTKNLFYSIPIDPSGSGFTSLPGNFGRVSNKGIELSLKGVVLKSKDFAWVIEGNLTYNKNRVDALPQDSIISGITILKEGKPMNTLFLVEYAGVDPANGNPLYMKKDKSGTTSTFSVNDKIYLGTTDPPLYGAVGTTITWGNLEASATFTFFLNRVVFNNDRSNLINPTYYFDNLSVEVLREWKQPGDITDVPRPGAVYSGQQSNSTRLVENGNFWRLRNVNLSYRFPESLISKVGLKSAKLFLQGMNWFTATKVQSFDPEYASGSIVGAQYPALVQTTVGLNIGF